MLFKYFSRQIKFSSIQVLFKPVRTLWLLWQVGVSKYTLINTVFDNNFNLAHLLNLLVSLLTFAKNFGPRSDPTKCFVGPGLDPTKLFDTDGIPEKYQQTTISQ